MKKVEKLSFMDDKAQRMRNLYNFVTVSLMISNSLLSKHNNNNKRLVNKEHFQISQTQFLLLLNCVCFSFL